MAYLVKCTDMSQSAKRPYLSYYSEYGKTRTYQPTLPKQSLSCSISKKVRRMILLNTGVLAFLAMRTSKALSQCMLVRINKETDGYLSDWQAGIRERRGCRDNIMIMMRTMFEDVVEQGREMCATFIDNSAAFDSVSHKFIDTTLQKAGASIKTRRMFRAIYKAASAVTKVNDVNGITSYSESFPIRRGVLQGDITSPVYFI